MSAADIASAASATDEKLRRDKLVTENLGLVHLCANRFRGRGVEYEELYSSGCVGLVKAAGAFDEERGVKFSTYAVPVILGEIKRVFRDGGTVKVSRSLKELSMKVTREKADFILKNGREPTVCELADIMGESAENIAEALSAALPCISLTGGEDEDGRQQDIAQCLALEGKPHQAAQIVLVRGERRTGQCPALQLYAAHRTLAVAVLRLQTEHPALGLGPAAVKAPAVPHTGTSQCRPGKILFPVAEECRVPGYAAGKSRIGKILDMPHKVAFLIVAGGHKTPHRTGCRINRMRHCSPARPADRP